MDKILVIALGGNAIKSAKERGTNDEQFSNVRKTTGHLAKLAQQGYKLVITHGNGPQVGNILIQNEAAKNLVPAMPMDVCGAETQGQIGYMIQQTLINHFQKMGLKKTAATVVTQVEVDPKDKAFQNPTKPVGPFYDKKDGEELKKKGYTVVEDSGRGYRRVVPSPIPIHITEIEAIKTLINSGIIVIASGGGGIPVIKKGNQYVGVEAVIDKDFAGELLAEKVKADYFIILTDVERVALNFNKPNQINLDKMTAKEAQKYYDQGHFAPGSMGPKVRAAIKFIKQGGKKVIITHPFKVDEALEEKTGTLIAGDKK
jgi:carbamate kinase